MEQTKEGSETSRAFSEDLASVYKHIDLYRTQIDSKYEQKNKSKLKALTTKVTIVVLIVIAGLYIALSLLPVSIWGDNSETIRLVLQLIILLVYVLGGASILLQYFSFKEEFKDFTGQIIGFASDSAEDEAAFFTVLDGLSTQSITYAANRIDNSSTQLSQIRSFILGTIEKVGIIPGLVATVFAINKVC